MSGVFWPGISIHHRWGRLPQRVERPSNDIAGGAIPMMNQETYVKLEDLHRQGWTIREIAAETGFHPATIAKRLKGGAHD